MDRGAWGGCNPRDHKELDTPEAVELHTHIFQKVCSPPPTQLFSFVCVCVYGRYFTFKVIFLFIFCSSVDPVIFFPQT